MFKVGDRVICKNNTFFTNYLTVGKEYTIIGPPAGHISNDELITIVGDNDISRTFDKSRFDLVKPDPMTLEEAMVKHYNRFAIYHPGAYELAVLRLVAQEAGYKFVAETTYKLVKE